ncbi:MAG: YicC/YloC family endoribonuclease [Cytophagales bacterium]|nr:MAG: YicC family protein [Rhodothermaeota bacterium MED-G18]
MHSMTGYGLISHQSKDLILEIEMKTINSKFFDFIFKSNLDSIMIEKEIRNLVKKKMIRGKVEVTCNISIKKKQERKINKKEFIKLYKEISGIVTNEKISKEAILNNTFLFYDKKQNISDKKIPKKTIIQITKNVLEKCIQSRSEEGKSIKKDLTKNINQISKSLKKIKKIEKRRVDKKRDKLESQIKKIKSIEIDEGRLEQELFYFLDKIDINEEVVRLTKHISLFNETIDEKGVLGKKLNFISQELGREINTLGAKCNDFEIQNLTIKMKSNLEKIKEESFNVL